MKLKFRNPFCILRLFFTICFICNIVNSQYLLSFSISNVLFGFNCETQTNEIKENFYFNPYVLEIKYKKCGILYYGSYHNVNLQHPQFQDIEKKWNNFKPDIAYSEGMRWPLIKSRDKAIMQNGEQGLLRYLAYRDKVKIKCIEPRRRNEMLYLLKKFTPTKIKIYYILRQIIINQEIFKKETNPYHIKIMLKNMTKIRFFNTSLKTVNEFSTMVKTLLPDLKDWRNIKSKYFMNVLNKKNWLAKINVKVNKYRDKHMVKSIIRSLKKGKKTFVVVGKSHVVQQEKVLLSKIQEL